MRYKLMFREKGQKKFYNFGPTIKPSFRYGKIKSRSEAIKLKNKLIRDFPKRTWKIKRK